MKLKIMALSLIVILSSALTIAAQAAPQQQAEAGAPEAPKSELQPVDLVITEKEVVAVQSALKQRGYYQPKPSRVFDRETRDALRAYQRDNSLPTTGKIDRPTLNSLKLTYPATGNEGDSTRRNGAVSKVVYGVKDTAVGATRAVTGASRKTVDTTKTGYDKVVNTTKTGYEKTTAAPGKAYEKTKDVVTGTGSSAANGMKSAGRKVTGATQRASDAVVGRSDADIHSDVRAVLDVDPQTKAWVSQVKEGQVTISLAAGQDAKLGDAIARIRKVSGVQTVMVTYQ